MSVDDPFPDDGFTRKRLPFQAPSGDLSAIPGRGNRPPDRKQSEADEIDDDAQLAMPAPAKESEDDQEEDLDTQDVPVHGDPLHDRSPSMSASAAASRLVTGILQPIRERIAAVRADADAGIGLGHRRDDHRRGPLDLCPMADRSLVSAPGTWVNRPRARERPDATYCRP